MFFFEKGTKKLLLFLCVWLNVARQHEKVFCFFFSKKKGLPFFSRHHPRVTRIRR